jgi:hypothetical protein
MKLWLDDERPAPPGWVWAKTSSEATLHLASGRVEDVSLDHDLGEQSGTGYDVACFIEAGAYDGTLRRMTWHVHSGNPVGAARIARAMENADRYWSRYESEDTRST